MASLSERAYSALIDNMSEHVNFELANILHDACLSIESLTEDRVAASSKIEALELRVEELEAQVTALAPPKSVGPVVKPMWKPISESDVIALQGE